MSIRLELTTGEEKWSFDQAEAVVPSPGDLVDIDSGSGSRSFRVRNRRIVLTEGELSGPTGLETSGLLSVGLDLEQV
jgi:hypothetical protein